MTEITISENVEYGSVAHFILAEKFCVATISELHSLICFRAGKSGYFLKENKDCSRGAIIGIQKNFLKIVSFLVGNVGGDLDRGAISRYVRWVRKFL